MLRFTIEEEQAKAMRVWEELGGPRYISLHDAQEILQQMTPTEYDEVPHWPKMRDGSNYEYILPLRFWKKTRSR